MIKILKKRILSNKGFSYVILSVLMVVILLMGVAIFEIIRINIQAAAVRDKFEDAITRCVLRITLRCTSRFVRAMLQAMRSTEYAGRKGTKPMSSTFELI